MKRDVVVCHISSVHQPYDTRIFLKECRSLASHYSVHLIVPAGFTVEQRDGVTLHGVFQPRRRWQRFFVWFQIARELGRIRPDLIHFHDIELMPLGVLLSTLTRARVVYDAHEYVAEDIRDKPWIPARLRPLVAAAVGRFEKWGVRHLDGAVAVNDHMRQQLVSSNPQVVTVANYPLLDEPWAMREAGHRLQLAYVGGISRDRGLDLLMEAVEQLSNSGVDVQCIVVGPVDTRGTDDARRERLLKAGRLILTGAVPFSRIGEFLPSDAVGVLPWLPLANNVLGTPTKLFEYMAAGLPVIAPDYGFIADVVRETGCGVLYQPGSPTAFAAAAAMLLADRGKQARMGAAGAAAVQRKYRWESQADALRGLYQQLLGC